MKMRTITIARKPFGGSVTRNVIRFEAGALNIQESKVPFEGTIGRWPSNVLLLPQTADHLDHQSGILTSGTGAVKKASARDRQGNRSATYGPESRPEGSKIFCYGDTGGASRFFRILRMDQ